MNQKSRTGLGSDYYQTGSTQSTTKKTSTLPKITLETEVPDSSVELLDPF